MEKEFDLDRLKELKIRFRKWAKENDYDSSFEAFIEANIEALGF